MHTNLRVFHPNKDLTFARAVRAVGEQKNVTVRKMDDEQRQLQNFVKTHGMRACKLPRGKFAYMINYTPCGVSLDEEFTRYTCADIISVFQTESHLTNWLLRQVETHDTESEHVVGLIFGINPLAYVLSVPSAVKF